MRNEYFRSQPVVTPNSAVPVSLQDATKENVVIYVRPKACPRLSLV